MGPLCTLHAPRSPQSLNNHNFYLFPIGFFVAILRVVATKLNVGIEQNTRTAAGGKEKEEEEEEVEEAIGEREWRIGESSAASVAASI